MVRHNRFLQISLTALVSAFLIFSAASAAGKSKKSKKERSVQQRMLSQRGHVAEPWDLPDELARYRVVE